MSSSPKVTLNLSSYMGEYLRQVSPNCSLAETFRKEAENYMEVRELESQAEGLIRYLERIRRSPQIQNHKIGTLSPEQQIFLTNQGFQVIKSDRMNDGEDCYYVSLP